MSAILSANDLNDFINPGVACIKQVEIPNYEVTKENDRPAHIAFTDCLACSGCVTSAEAVLISLQSHDEVLNTLDRFPEKSWNGEKRDGKIFIATVSPQARASIAATYKISERHAGHLIAQLLSGPEGLRAGGAHGSGFHWLIDSNALRDLALVTTADEISSSSDASPKTPVLTSACPGWICYAEKTHPHILPHLSRIKSPQALAGTIVKSILASQLGVSPADVWHLAIMPCFDKKLEASRTELASQAWRKNVDEAVRDVDCVITPRELLKLAQTRGISLHNFPRKPVNQAPFPDPIIDRFLFRRRLPRPPDLPADQVGTGGGYLYHILKNQQSLHPNSTLQVKPGRNSDVAVYEIISPDGTSLFKAARYYGFRNIQNLVRGLKPSKPSRIPDARVPHKKSVGVSDYAYAEVMACPGGCTNGGGQIKVDDLREMDGEARIDLTSKQWLAEVDEAYWSADSDEMEKTESRIDDGSSHGKIIDGIDHDYVLGVLDHWAEITRTKKEDLVYTSYREVKKNVGLSAAMVADGGW
ncbi:iron hydrogenase [Piedraia hortae CBS 480.64]|uniref:Nuclear architecture-related protein 1 n=1 Tax=Piedraia hortae CBS 480.64 TaxID=1314780 RepID=A0A6A7C871_9PEZI|nr:iron hydrogenase [Piedraia hortae CBS 480.64]